MTNGVIVSGEQCEVRKGLQRQLIGAEYEYGCVLTKKCEKDPWVGESHSCQAVSGRGLGERVEIYCGSGR